VANDWAALVPDAPIEPTFDLGRNTYLLYGLPKIGKSSFANEFPGAVFVPTEPGLSQIRHFQIPPTGYCDSWASIGKACLALDTPKARERFKVIVVDTVDNAYLACERFICAERGVKTVQELGYGVGTGLVATEFRRVMLKLISLGYGVVFVSHAELKEFQEPNGAKYDRIVPTVPDRARRLINGLVDHILYFGMASVQVPDGMGGVRIADGRVIKCKPSRGYDAGGRLEMPDDVLAVGGPAETFAAFAAAHAAAAKDRAGKLAGIVPVTFDSRAKFSGKK
jgi:hypothetical protein